VSDHSAAIVDWAQFSKARSELGASFIRILGYFREDGVKAVAAIEEAVRQRNAAALVLPAHSLKGEARQFGADPLADIAEQIEVTSRRCVEDRDTPDALVEVVVKLRPLFEQTLALFERETNPLVDRRPAFGRKPLAQAGSGQG